MRSIIGIFLIVLGLLAFMDISGLMEIDFWQVVGDWWPSIFVIMGVSCLIKGEAIFNGAVFVLIGSTWVASNIELIPLGFWELIVPMIFVTIGLYLVLNKKGKKVYSDVASDEYLNVKALFSGQKQRVTSNNFKGGSIEAIFSGIEIDMRDAIISSEFLTLEIDAMFSGVEIWLPRNVNVHIEGSPVFGGLKNNIARDKNADYPTIRINYSAVFSGIDLKN